MAFSLNKVRDDLTDDLEAQLVSLKREVASLRKSLAKKGSAAYEDGRESAADLYDELAERISDALPHIRRQSRVVQKAASDNPITAAVIGLALVGTLALLFSRR